MLIRRYLPTYLCLCSLKVATLPCPTLKRNCKSCHQVLLPTLMKTQCQKQIPCGSSTNHCLSSYKARLPDLTMDVLDSLTVAGGNVPLVLAVTVWLFWRDGEAVGRVRDAWSRLKVCRGEGWFWTGGRCEFWSAVWERVWCGWERVFCHCCFNAASFKSTWHFSGWRISWQYTSSLKNSIKLSRYTTKKGR